MTVAALIDLADELVPNVFSAGVKLFEYNRLEQRIRVDILGEDPDDVETVSEADMDTAALTLADRYQDVYLYWMKSMYYWHMGEAEAYENEKAMFDAAWLRWERDVCDEFHQGSGATEYE